jgi:imidazolonepropionase
VRDVRSRSQEELESLTRDRLRGMLELGTTTAEIKSGYGLETEAELKMLRVVRTLAAEGPVDLVPTFLGAHEFPPEYGERHDDYVELLIDEMIPAVAAEDLAVYCDVFMEPGVYTADQARRILEAGLLYGLKPRLHADELEGSGGAELAAELGAASADHLGAISDAGIRALARAGTVATLLPATLFFLGRPERAPARKLIDAGATVAIAEHATRHDDGVFIDGHGSVRGAPRGNRRRRGGARTRGRAGHDPRGRARRPHRLGCRGLRGDTVPFRPAANPLGMEARKTGALTVVALSGPVYVTRR